MPNDKPITTDDWMLTTTQSKINEAVKNTGGLMPEPVTTPVDEHNFIYLQPWCKDCKDACDDRQWCQDDAWGECEECGLKPVKYARVK